MISNGPSLNSGEGRCTEPWFWRLLSGISPGAVS